MKNEENIPDKSVSQYSTINSQIHWQRAARLTSVKCRTTKTKQRWTSKKYSVDFVGSTDV